MTRIGRFTATSLAAAGAVLAAGNAYAASAKDLVGTWQ